ALHVLRILQEEAMKENTGGVHAPVPVDVSSFRLNEKRAEIQKLEARLKVDIVLVPNPHLETPHYKVQRLRHEELNEMEHVPSSYELVERPEEPKAPGEEAEPKRERQIAVVKGITPDQPAPRGPRRRRSPAAGPARAAPRWAGAARRSPAGAAASAATVTTPAATAAARARARSRRAAPRRAQASPGPAPRAPRRKCAGSGSS